MQFSWRFPGFFLVLENRKFLKCVLLQQWWRWGVLSGPDAHDTGVGSFRTRKELSERIWSKTHVKSAKIENPKSCRKCAEYLRGHPRTGPGASEAMLGSLERLIHFVPPKTPRLLHSGPWWRKFRLCGFGPGGGSRRPELPRRNHRWLGDTPCSVFGGDPQGSRTAISRTETIQVPSA